MAVLVAALLARPAHAEPEVLRDLRAVSIAVAVSSKLQDYAPTVDLKARCEARLKAAGVPMYTPAERFDPADGEQWAQSDLFLNLTAVKVCDGSFAVFIRLSGSQVLGQLRGKDEWRMTAGEIWSSGRLVVGEQAKIKAIVNGQVDAILDTFIGDWQVTHSAVSSSESIPSHP